MVLSPGESCRILYNLTKKTASDKKARERTKNAGCLLQRQRLLFGSMLDSFLWKKWNSLVGVFFLKPTGVRLHSHDGVACVL